MYIFVNKADLVNMRSVSDIELNNLFKEAISYCNRLMIEEVHGFKKVRKSIFKTETISHITYNVYHETPAFDGSAYQAMYMSCASGDAEKVSAYLYGIINGALSQINALNQSI